MIDIIIQGVTGFVLGLVIVVYFAGFLTPLAVIRMTLNFNNLTKFGILTYFIFIVSGLFEKKLPKIYIEEKAEN